MLINKKGSDLFKQEPWLSFVSYMRFVKKYLMYILIPLCKFYDTSVIGFILNKVYHWKVMERNAYLILKFNGKKIESITLDHYTYFFTMKRQIVHIKNSRRT